MPLAAVTVSELKEHLSRYPLGPDSVVFTSPQGAFVRRSGLGGAWRKAVATAGFDRPVRFHDLRHYYASVLIS